MSLLASRVGLLAVVLAALAFSAAACQEREHPCDAFERFALVLEAQCGTLDWDCWERYPTLGPEAQQDLDWCMDCVLLAEEGEGGAHCQEEAPLSGLPCAELLRDTLDATCFDSP